MKQKKIPMRMCIGCKEMKPKSEMIRLVQPKDGELSKDLTGKAHGRGSYICPNMDCVNLAKKSKAVKLSKEMFAELEKEIESRGKSI